MGYLSLTSQELTVQFFSAAFAQILHKIKLRTLTLFRLEPKWSKIVDLY